MQLAVMILAWSGSDPTENIELAHALRVARILRILRVWRLCRRGLAKAAPGSQHASCRRAQDRLGAFPALAPVSQEDPELRPARAQRACSAAACRGLPALPAALHHAPAPPPQVLRLVKHLYLHHMSGAKRLLGLKPHTLHCLQLLYVSRGGFLGAAAAQCLLLFPAG